MWIVLPGNVKDRHYWMYIDGPSLFFMQCHHQIHINIYYYVYGNL